MKRKEPQPLTPELIRDVIDRAIILEVEMSLPDFHELSEAEKKACFDQACEELGFPNMLNCPNLPAAPGQN